MLTSTSGTPDLTRILRTGAIITNVSVGTDVSQHYDGRFDKALIAYIESLKPPKYAGALNGALVEQGRQIFNQACTSCHGGPGFAGTEIYSLDVIGTD